MPAHTVVHDHSWVAYAEICADEKATTTIAVLRRAVAWFTEKTPYRPQTIREGKAEIMRRLKRYVARDTYRLLTNPA